MDPFKLQRSILRPILAERPSMQAGMELTIDRLATTRRGEVWNQCRDIDWPRAQVRWIDWFDALLKKHPPPRDTQLLWFEIPSELNPALTSVSAYQQLGPKSESWGLNEHRTWPKNKRGNTLPAGLHELPELEAALRRVEWGRTDGEHDEDLLPAVYAISTACAALLVINGLPRTAILGSIDATDIAAILGWVDGDMDPVGQLTPRGWEPIRRVRPVPRPPSPEELDPDSYAFNVSAYLKAGGDPDARTSEGEPLLISVIFEHEVRALIRAGADVNARSRDDLVPLATINAQDLPTLRALLEAGADPNVTVRRGIPVLFEFLTSGLLKPAQLELLFAAGASARVRDKDGNSAIHILANTSLDSAPESRIFRECLTLLIDKGCDINRRNKKGITPLWKPLLSFAERSKWLQREAAADEMPAEAKIMRFGRGYAKTIELLLASGADPNSRTKEKLHPLIPAGATPLMVQSYGDGAVHRALLAAGAKPGLKSADGLSAIDYARKTLEKAEKVWRIVSRYPKDSPERRALLVKHPEDPKVIKRLLAAMEG